MAIDTAEKRRSASQTITGLFGPGVTPNSGTDKEWRQQVGWGYSGIAAVSGDTTISVVEIAFPFTAQTITTIQNILVTITNALFKFTGWAVSVTGEVTGAFSQFRTIKPVIDKTIRYVIKKPPE